ncbi:MAG: hypothetical protein A2W93_02490 [Bacteroidetes bacterium GWF2_43_63]|nr:MAG: hypothetical protein A2W94_08500 [Bacteroidetes bacterium GWE2_42_42]OFY53538.1 MAG: hypothetical protein A2W93_02490 [Bacteroidetes bacterium GWF2_43_63]HBG71132.1 hypothetical protein [Bacteroidales bacterium]HCB63709.1 hypothetical protein [Bacteroidales bacterium]HCY24458.1 hypothetical protein [Bacteroidales bacterium]
MKTLKVIAIESLITIISLVMIVRTLIIENKIEHKIFLSIGIGLSIVYMIYRIASKIKEEKEKSRINAIVASKLNKASESFLYYIDLILINHPERFNISIKEKSNYQTEQNAKKMFEVDFRTPDPYTGTSMGNLAEQVDFGMNREYDELERTISRYTNKISTKKIELFESLSSNLIFKTLIDCKLWFDQIKMFHDQAIKNNPTFPKNGLPITISMNFKEHQKDYNQMIDLLFEMKNIPNSK